MRLTPLLLRGLALLLAGLTPAQGETLRLRTDPWMPFNGDPASALPGYAIEILRLVMAPHDITVDYQNMAWSDALEACAEGKVDAVVGANTVEAAKLVLPTESIGAPRVGLFIAAANPWKYTNIPALASVRLGVIKDYKYFGALDNYIARNAGPGIVTFPDGEQLESAIKQLVAGGIDVLAEVYPVFAWTARNAGFKPDQFRLAYLHEGESVYIAFAPNEAGRRYAQLFDQGIRQLRSSGQLEEILKRYGQKDWAP